MLFLLRVRRTTVGATISVLISVIIPTLDEERALPATLDALLCQTGYFEVVVVDGGSVDRTREIVIDRSTRDPRIRLLESGRGRARQMNAGASEASGEWLLFLHADTLLPPGGLARIGSQPEKVRAGCFRHCFSGNGAMLRILSWFHNNRFHFTKVIYGDQGLFIRRGLFDELGGFPDRQMEDIAFGLELRRAATPVMVPDTVVTDSRKFEQMGPWRALAHAVWLLVRFRFDADIERDAFFEDYR